MKALISNNDAYAIAASLDILATTNIRHRVEVRNSGNGKVSTATLGSKAALALLVRTMLNERLKAHLATHHIPAAWAKELLDRRPHTLSGTWCAVNSMTVEECVKYYNVSGSDVMTIK